LHKKNLLILSCLPGWLEALCHRAGVVLEKCQKNVFQ
jgi:hypothetical protein